MNPQASRAVSLSRVLVGGLMAVLLIATPLFVWDRTRNPAQISLDDDE